MSDRIQNDLGHINLRGEAGNRRIVDSAKTVLGQSLPTKPNTVSLGAHRIYWLGPDEWLIVTGLQAVSELEQQLHTALEGQHVAINDLSGGQVAFRLPGRDVPERLARGCTLDLHPEKFGLGACAQTGLAKANVLLGNIGDEPCYELIVRRSFSDYVMRWLANAGLLADRDAPAN